LRSGGRGANPRDRLKECTPMIHNGISVAHLQVRKKNTIGRTL